MSKSKNKNKKDATTKNAEGAEKEQAATKLSPEVASLVDRKERGARINELYRERGDRPLTSKEHSELERLEREEGQTMAPFLEVRTALGTYREVRIGMIEASPTNPRKSFEPTALAELSENVKRYGILQPLLVRPNRKRMLGMRPVKTGVFDVIDTEKGNTLEICDSQEDAQAVLALGAFELVAGERRFRAAKMAGIETAPVIARELNDGEVLEIQYIENLQREDLTAMEEAEGFALLIESKRYTAESLAEKLGKSRSHVFGRLRLLKMIPEVKAAVQSGALPQTIAELVAKLPTAEIQKEALGRVMMGGFGYYEGTTFRHECMSFRTAKEFLLREYTLDLEEAPFEMAEAGFVFAPACVDCPKRSGNCREEYPEIKGPNVCTDPTCYDRKKKASAAIKLERYAREKGIEALALDVCEKLFGIGNWLRGDEYRKLDDEADLVDATEDDTEDDTFEKWLPAPESEGFAAITGSGECVTVYRAKDLYAELKAKGVKFYEEEIELGPEGETKEERAERERLRREKYEEEEAKRKEEWEIEQEVLGKAFEEIRRELKEEPIGESAANARGIWTFLLGEISDMNSNDALPLELRGLNVDEVRRVNYQSLSVSEMRNVALECFMMGFGMNEFQERPVKIMADVFGIDMGAIEKGVRAGREEPEPELTPKETKETKKGRGK